MCLVKRSRLSHISFSRTWAIRTELLRNTLLCEPYQTQTRRCDLLDIGVRSLWRPRKSISAADCILADRNHVTTAIRELDVGPRKWGHSTVWSLRSLKCPDWFVWFLAYVRKVFFSVLFLLQSVGLYVRQSENYQHTCSAHELLRSLTNE